MSQAHSITELLHRLENEESDAARRIWDRFIHRLIYESRDRLMNLPRRAVDEEDVAAMAFQAFFDGVAQNSFQRLENRDDMWQVLAMLAERRAMDVMRMELADMRGGGKNRGESVFENLLGEDSAAGGIGEMPDLEPEVIDGFTKETRERLEELEESVREVVMLKLQGYTNEEVSEQLDMALRTVERKLQLARSQWESTL